VPGDVTGLIHIHFMPDVLVAFFAHVRCLLEIAAHLLVECLEVSEEILPVQLPALGLVEGGEEVLHLFVAILLVLLLLFLLFLIRLVNEVIELQGLLVSSNDLSFLVHKQEANATLDRSVNLQVGLHLGFLDEQLPDFETVASERRGGDQLELSLVGHRGSTQQGALRVKVLDLRDTSVSVGMGVDDMLADTFVDDPLLDLGSLSSDEEVVLVDLVHVGGLVAELESFDDVLSSGLQVNNGNVDERLLVV